jgi:hypothetical protein
MAVDAAELQLRIVKQFLVQRDALLSGFTIATITMECDAREAKRGPSSQPRIASP